MYEKIETGFSGSYAVKHVVTKAINAKKYILLQESPWYKTNEIYEIYKKDRSADGFDRIGGDFRLQSIRRRPW